ncbi:response regulator transcription factor [Arachidicoccus sp.]|uniref:response regulator transcription factor n=1 Tax=Arachidicoccus sp. TaxID=1872624 RepID=UPI003D25C755
MIQKKIFIVEDNEDIRDVIQLILNDSNYIVFALGTIAEFRIELSIELPDLIILDIQLPDGNGIDLCKEIKKSTNTKRIPVLLMSAITHPNLKDSCGDDFIGKPFNINKFKNTVERLLIDSYIN